MKQPPHDPPSQVRRKPQPNLLPRHEVQDQPETDYGCTFPACGDAMGKLGEDVTEVID